MIQWDEKIAKKWIANRRQQFIKDLDLIVHEERIRTGAVKELDAQETALQKFFYLYTWYNSWFNSFYDAEVHERLKNQTNDEEDTATDDNGSNA